MDFNHFDRHEDSPDFELLNLRRSSFCGTGACVVVAFLPGKVLVLDSKLGGKSPILEFTPDEWRDEAARVECGLLPTGAVWSNETAEDTVAWGPLRFTVEELDKFAAGVANGEFDPDRLSTPAPDPARQVPEGAVPVGTGSGLAATGAGEDTSTSPAGRTSSLPGPAPVATQPRYILDKDAILNLALRLADTAVAAALERRSCNPDAASRYDAKFDELLAAIGAALTPVPDVEPEPAWGSGPLVDHNPSAGGTP